MFMSISKYLADNLLKAFEIALLEMISLNCVLKFVYTSGVL